MHLLKWENKSIGLVQGLLNTALQYFLPWAQGSTDNVHKNNPVHTVVDRLSYHQLCQKVAKTRQLCCILMHPKHQEIKARHTGKWSIKTCNNPKSATVQMAGM
ncbi:hypothetical protein KIL84_003872 [Mauremys mutica]|uniref:Uncharacterized protein n=1 Tax=Mauremys mutica TaxID=74926 RepID=A0A9D4ARY5_9SAUR|nr:hypothetical protein KIL84_003872 [Mauremys mutica]